MQPPGEASVSHADFERFIAKLLRATGATVKEQPHGDRGWDLEVTRMGAAPIFVECKLITPQTTHRLTSAFDQISSYAHTSDNPRVGMALATPGALSGSAKEFANRFGISIWDADWIRETADRVGLAEEAACIVGDEPSEQEQQTTNILIERLRAVEPGRRHWSQYQKLCREITHELFCPPLSAPIWERANLDATNKRDLILPNYAPDGLWAFFRSEYRADFVVIDAKNYRESIKKEEVLQIANYLQRHGAGLFALIFCRTPIDAKLVYILREQWVLYDKLITPLHDEDVVQMLTAKEHGRDPAEVIRQKIEDFRLQI
ncbi:restriction endonuclease [Streptomyces sp. NPDC020800]|uniref:restriction endonuclease n=1 Tax=Streptomyces sp. NPDC020800 TaxID=3365092 RepID=UPI0037A78555